MFDDPKKELQELEDQLLAAEDDQETADLDTAEFEKLYDEILEEFGPGKASQPEPDAPAELPIRNFANGYGKAVAPQPLGTDGDEILADDEPLEAPKPIRGLVILACLETLAIAGLAVYWFLRFA